MTITTSTGQTHVSEADLLALTLRFEIKPVPGSDPRFFVDGVEVSAAEYRRAFNAEIRLPPAS